jgi:hypothetical protein
MRWLKQQFQSEIEQAIQTIRPENCRSQHRIFTERPHMAGTVRNYELAQHVAKQWKEYGLEDVELIEHPVYLPWPIRYEATLVGPRSQTRGVGN